MNNKVSIIITNLKGKTTQFSIKQTIFYSLLSLVTVLCIGLIISITSNIFLYNHYTKTSIYKKNQDQQKIVIESLQNDVKSLKKLIENLIKKEEEIRQDLGKPKYRKLSKRKLIRRKINKFRRSFPKDNYDQFKTHQLSHEINFIKTYTLSIEKKIRRHLKTSHQYRNWFENTPSIWPVYGYIRSGFGLRKHPLRRVKQFHKGIDIPAWKGAPVQATADGFVEFSGWGGGYGWMIVLSHSFGYQTIYAHLSEVEVSQGLKVSKGQIIGKIGSTGLSTGPHVHYEIRRRRKAVNPTPYLTLNLFTAISKLW